VDAFEYQHVARLAAAIAGNSVISEVSSSNPRAPPGRRFERGCGLT